jgi:hypothetical protein
MEGCHRSLRAGTPNKPLNEPTTMKCEVTMDSTPERQFPNEVMTYGVIGSVVKPGYVEYGFDGMIAYHHNVVEYFRASASAKNITLAFYPNQPLMASALHRLFTLVGRRVRKVHVINRRDDSSVYARLEFDGVMVASVRPVEVSFGTIYLLVFQADSGRVQF